MGRIELTKAEEEVMQILWEMKQGFVKEVLEKMPEPKPAYNTVSTIIRILVKKKIVGFKAFGRTHQYFPLISKEEYLKSSTDNLMNKYFSNSFENLVSFFVKEKNLSTSEIERILKNIDKL